MTSPSQFFWAKKKKSFPPLARRSSEVTLGDFLNVGSGSTALKLSFFFPPLQAVALKCSTIGSSSKPLALIFCSLLLWIFYPHFFLRYFSLEESKEASPLQVGSGGSNKETRTVRSHWNGLMWVRELCSFLSTCNGISICNFNEQPAQVSQASPELTGLVVSRQCGVCFLFESFSLQTFAV